MHKSRTLYFINRTASQEHEKTLSTRKSTMCWEQYPVRAWISRATGNSEDNQPQETLITQ